MGAENAASVYAASRTTTVVRDRTRSFEPYIGRSISPVPRRLVVEQKVENGEGQQAEHQIIETEDQRPASCDGPCAARGEQRRGGLGRADDHRYEQRQRHQWQDQ